MSDFTQTPNLRLFKPTYDADDEMWGYHLNANADVLDAALSTGAGGTFLPLAGGTMTGPLGITGTAATSSVPTPALSTTWTYSGNTGASSTVQVQSVNNVNINGATGTSVWANRDILSYSAPTPASGQPTYVARSMLAMAQNDRGPSGPQIWGAIVDVIDTTTHPSSVGGNLLALEVNVEAGGVDDANIRQAIVINVMNRTYPTTATCEIANGLHIVAGDAYTTMHNPIIIALPFSTAAINLNGATSLSGAPAIWLPQGAGISFDNSKYTNLVWNTADSAFEFQWAGSPVWSLDSAGDMTVKQNVWIGQGFGISFDGGHNTRLLWSGADSAMAFQWAGSTVWKLDPGGSMTVNGNSSLHQCGFNGTTPIAKPTVTGAKGGNAALASLMTALAAYGLVTDSTT